MAEVRSHIKSRRRPGEPSKEVVQVAHGKAIASLELRKFAKAASERSVKKRPLILEPDQLVSPVKGGMHAGFGGENRGLAYASMFSVAMGKADAKFGAAMLFYSYGQKSFYRHVRAVLDAMPASKLLPAPKRRKNPSAKHGSSPLADSLQNRLVARSLRFCRIFLQHEMIPLALKIGCGKGTIWHIETGNNVVAPKWVEAYALALGVAEQGIWDFAAALGEGPAADGCAKDMVKKFVQIVLG